MHRRAGKRNANSGKSLRHSFVLFSAGSIGAKPLEEEEDCFLRKQGFSTRKKRRKILPQGISYVGCGVLVPLFNVIFGKGELIKFSRCVRNRGGV